MYDTDVVDAIRSRFAVLGPVMDERVRRLWAGAEARAVGRGGVAAVVRATGLAGNTVRAGVRESADAGAATALPAGRVRRPGGGRKRLAESDPTLARDLDAVVEPTARGDPASPLRWTCESTRRLAAELNKGGGGGGGGGGKRRVGHVAVAGLLRAAGYSLQANRKTREGGTHPDRDAQFGHVAARVADAQAKGQPAVSVDAKKKELIGEFKNGGREWRPTGEPEEVKVYDFIDKAPDKGRVTPYGVYDLAANEAWVSVGTDHDTARFAAETVRRWWAEMGRGRYPAATDLTITADGGGSKGSRCRLWKVALQDVADATGLTLNVSHLPPGTSKWNRIEHRLFCHVTRNWRGRPLVSHDVAVGPIGATTAAKGLRVRAGLDTARYPTGVTVSDREMAGLNLTREPFHGEWNYTITPRDKPSHCS